MNRHTRMWRVRYWMGGHVQRLAWRLFDPHDRWMIDYRDRQGRAYAVVREGFYSVARASARELRGKIVGNNASQPMPVDDADGWKFRP
jgi:hypothetical protein